MNCAPVSVKAGAGSTRAVKERRIAHDKRQSTYPDLFLANIGDASNGCDTSEALAQQVAIQYPSPGDSVSFPNGDDGLFKQACDGNSRNNGGGGSGDSAAPATGARPSATRGGTAGLAPPSASGQTAAGASGNASEDGACTDGHLLCVGGTGFSTCTGGEWTASQALASNARCKEQGESVGLDITNTY